MRNRTWWILVVVGCVAIGIAVLVWGSRTLLKDGENVGSPFAEITPIGSSSEVSGDQASVQPSASRIAPPDTKEFKHDTFRFSLFYPNSLQIHTYDEGGGAATITFQNPGEGYGFQIFIVPYGEAQISEERFRHDVPNGVREGVKEIQIDGVTGVSFYSKNISLGETAEIWFIHGGYLYEVTTLKPLAPWLSNIMQTWQFI